MCPCSSFVEICATSRPRKAQASQAVTWGSVAKPWQSIFSIAISFSACWDKQSCRPAAALRLHRSHVGHRFYAQRKHSCPKAALKVCRNAVRVFVGRCNLAHARDLWLRISKPAIRLRCRRQGIDAVPLCSRAWWRLSLAQICGPQGTGRKGCMSVAAGDIYIYIYIVTIGPGAIKSMLWKQTLKPNLQPEPDMCRS